MVHCPGLVGAQNQLTDLSRRHLAVVIVDHPRFDPWTRLAASSGFRRIKIRQHGGGHLRHVERGAHFDSVATTHRHRVLVPGHTDRLLQRMFRIPVAGRKLQQEWNHSAEQTGHGELIFTNGLPELVGFEVRVQKAGSAIGHGRVDEASTADMKHRQVDQDSIAGFDVGPRDRSHGVTLNI